MEGNIIMTEKEEKLIRDLFDEKIKSIEKLFNEKIKSMTDITQNIQTNVNNFINTTSKSNSKFNTNISELYTKTGKNEIEITRLNGEIETIKEVKKAVNGTKDRGIKMWQFWLAFSIPTIMSIILGIITIINSLP